MERGHHPHRPAVLHGGDPAHHGCAPGAEYLLFIISGNPKPKHTGPAAPRAAPCLCCQPPRRCSAWWRASAPAGAPPCCRFLRVGLTALCRATPRPPLPAPGPFVAGAISTSAEEKRKMARESLAYNVRNPTFRSAPVPRLVCCRCGCCGCGRCRASLIVCTATLKCGAPLPTHQIVVPHTRARLPACCAAQEAVP